jgi:Nitroreductase
MGNAVLDTIHARRAIRNFSPEMPPREEIEQVIDAGVWAASGKGAQSPIVIAITEKGLRNQISSMNARIMGASEGMDPFYGAPVILVVLARRDVATHVYDGSLVIGNMMLAARSLGLGSIWIHRAKEEFDSDEGREILAGLGVEGDYEGIGHCALGYEVDPTPDATDRKPNRIFWAE